MRAAMEGRCCFKGCSCPWKGERSLPASTYSHPPFSGSGRLRAAVGGGGVYGLFFLFSVHQEPPRTTSQAYFRVYGPCRCTVNSVSSWSHLPPIQFCHNQTQQAIQGKASVGEVRSSQGKQRLVNIHKGQGLDTHPCMCGPHAETWLKRIITHVEAIRGLNATRKGPMSPGERVCVYNQWEKGGPTGWFGAPCPPMQ